MATDYAAIPVPAADVNSLLACVQALKQTVEALVGLRGTSSSTVITSKNIGDFTSINDNTITLAKLVQQAAGTILGNNTGAPGPVLALSAAQVLSLLQAVSLVNQDQTLSGGANVNPYAIPGGSFTVDCGKCPLQYWTNSGAATIYAPGNDGSCMILISNSSTAGSLSFSGFTVSGNTGDALTTANGSHFMLTIVRIAGVSTFAVKALQ